ncbi:MAG TPA: hypothetical protein H9717_09025 [Candidatus Eisenbergiella merdipullorum]|uniref:Uncharacterized protein n=1 Tax=Candidatus Eisenbergiella merdipullorum TaxID=2838553 RepID=A0A9D2I7G7_9FIRM|nr:hypothetical protein [Candidatus Eisenbergiella merdipullorum]
MFFHASPVPNLKELTPHISNHGTPLIYFSAKRENVLVYLSNAVEKCCREAGFHHDGPWKKWGSYGFTKDSILVLEEYYPDATIETYGGVSGYIYSAKSIMDAIPLPDIPFTFTTSAPTTIDECEYVPDAYVALLRAEAEGRIILHSFSQNSRKKLEWIHQSVQSEYAQSSSCPDYRFFLRTKFPDLF